MRGAFFWGMGSGDTIVTSGSNLWALGCVSHFFRARLCDGGVPAEILSTEGEPVADG